VNKRQKILTGVAIVALVIWAVVFNDDMGQSEKYRPSPAGDLGALFVILVAYVGVFFMIKTPKPPAP
jgi:hypothetical protein